ncbi:MAG TPA: class I SAM-dependent methyltransferase [Myxococcales bacterium]|jgi:SAM-dependent methyltransferase|nr:class I SAM-dependent methyltransferase [Myxococcales bacterium]
MNAPRAFEALYRGSAEPYDYSWRAAERLRHQLIAETIEGLDPRPVRVLDVGCSQGQLTFRIGPLSSMTFAMDVSPTAVAKARERCEGAAGRFAFAVASATALPFDSGAFDLVVLCDGLWEWGLSAPDREAALVEAHRLARAGGHVLLTEYLRPKAFAGFIREVEQGPLRILSVRYLYDRLWYQVETWFRRARHRRAVRAVFSSLGFAQFMGGVGRLFGKHGARHICILTRKDA